MLACGAHACMASRCRWCGSGCSKYRALSPRWRRRRGGARTAAADASAAQQAESAAAMAQRQRPTTASAAYYPATYYVPSRGTYFVPVFY